MTRKRTSEKDLVASATGAAATARRKAPARPRAKRATEPLAAPAAVAAAPQTVAPQTAPRVTIIYEPTYEEIAALAYSYWESRGHQGGSSEQDWLRAEAELRVRASAAVA